jgi:hypothetical protein
MSQLGQTEKSGLATGKSALPSITDFVRGHRHVSKVPNPELAARHSACSWRQRRARHCFLQDDRTEGVVRHFPDWWRRPSPIKHLRSEPRRPELHTEGNAFGSGQPIRVLFWPRALPAGFAWLCDTAVHDMIPEHKQT